MKPDRGIRGRASQSIQYTSCAAGDTRLPRRPVPGTARPRYPHLPIPSRATACRGYRTQGAAWHGLCSLSRQSRFNRGILMSANVWVITDATGSPGRESLNRITEAIDAFSQIRGMLLETRKLCPRLSPAETRTGRVSDSSPRSPRTAVISPSPASSAAKTSRTSPASSPDTAESSTVSTARRWQRPCSTGRALPARDGATHHALRRERRKP